MEHGFTFSNELIMVYLRHSRSSYIYTISIFSTTWILKASAKTVAILSSAQLGCVRLPSVIKGMLWSVF